MRFHRVLVAALAVVLLAFFVSLVPQKNASAAPPNTPVVVVNTPLPVTGGVNVTNTVPVTGTVAVSSLPSVALAGTSPVNVTNTVGVTGSVAVSSLPAVTLNGTPAVSLSNTATTPIYVDADRSARNGFAGQCTATVDPSSGQGGCILATISQPAVIETVSCHVVVGTGNAPQLQLNVPSQPPGGGAQPTNVSYFLAPTMIYGDSSTQIWRFASPLHIYASGPGQGFGGVSIGFNLQTAAGAAVSQAAICSISGYIVGQ